MDKHAQLVAYLQQHPNSVGKVVDYDPDADKLYPFDFTAANQELNFNIIRDPDAFSEWVSDKLQTTGSKYGIGGYLEHRTIYAVSALFDSDDEPRRLHLGVDIWAHAGTAVYAPLAGVVHSFADNDSYGNYGPTIILQHNLNGLTLYSLYGHLNRSCLNGLYAGKPVALNQQIAEFGNITENGHWPPHLHFQLIFAIGDATGDYPGVGRFSEMDTWKQNIPDPELMLRFNR